MSKPTDERIAGFLVETMRKIDKYGWTVIAVFPTESDPGFPFAYTAGLTEMSLPELIVVGLPAKVSHGVLNNAAERASTQPFDLDTDYDDIAGDDYKVRFRRSPTDLLAVARKLYPNVTALQLVWPDKAGRFPGDDAFDPALRDVQPLLVPRLRFPDDPE